MAEILIDGYNLIRQTEGLAQQEYRKGLEAGREALIRRLSAFRRATGDVIMVVFDGDDGFDNMPRSYKKMGVTVIFSQPPQTADDVIISRVQRSHGKKSLRIVSSDRAIVQSAKQHKIETISSEAFACKMAQHQMIGPKHRVQDNSSEELTEKDIADWEAFFKTETRLFEDCDAER